ncbi:MAG: hypothetical protein MI920_12770, partial [Kiloniellales bacterium]|nr:hypothetical protein [Kiloniellales bacterium]
PGRYRLEAAQAVTIDGVAYEPGAEIVLAVGHHRAMSSGPGQPAALRWAAARPGPALAPPEEPLYRGF